jgi:asparagine synthase (glutamine-hydrolysing)
VARLASKFVRVALSGAGGDEIFGGYPWRYQHAIQAQGPEDFYSRYYGFWQRLVPDDEKAAFFNDTTFGALKHQSTLEIFKDVLAPVADHLDTADDRLYASLYFELKTFLHGLLVVEDKISMAHGLETRVPFLDNDLADFGMALPPRFKLRHLDPAGAARTEDDVGEWRDELRTSQGKVVLRRAMRGLIPHEAAGRAKQGFSAPDASWFRGESIDYVSKLLRNPRSRIYDFIEYDYAARQLDDHVQGRRNRRLLIWSLLSFEWWLRRFMA